MLRGAASIALLHMGEVLTLINVMTQVERGNEQLGVARGPCEPWNRKYKCSKVKVGNVKSSKSFWVLRSKFCITWSWEEEVHDSPFTCKSQSKWTFCCWWWWWWPFSSPLQTNEKEYRAHIYHLKQPTNFLFLCFDFLFFKPSKLPLYLHQTYQQQQLEITCRMSRDNCFTLCCSLYQRKK